nr:MAG TPA: hypothetical protein [Inoviridae sp.]
MSSISRSERLCPAAKRERITSVAQYGSLIPQSSVRPSRPVIVHCRIYALPAFPLNLSGNSQRSSRMTTQTMRQDTSTRMNRQTSTIAAVTRNFIIAIPHFKIVLTCDRYIKTDPRPRP